MKKLLFLLCALILVFSLCSCQGAETAKTGGQPQGKRTAEEAIESGALLSTVDLIDEVEADVEAANKTYAGKYYLMNLVVSSLSYPDVVWAGFNFSLDPPLFSNVNFTMDLPEEERESLAIRDVLQVVGKITNIEKRLNGLFFVEVSDAHCVTKTFQVSGTVQGIGILYGTELVIAEDSGNVFPKGEITVHAPGNGSYQKGDRITAAGTLRAGERQGHMIVNESAWPFYFYMENPESVEIVTSQE